MKNRIPNRARGENQADKSTLGLLVILIIVIFMALTFGEAEGAGQLTKYFSGFPVSSL